MDKCQHLSEAECSNKNCSLHKGSPWPCFNRFHDVFDNQDDRDQVYRDYGQVLVDRNDNCPRRKYDSDEQNERESLGCAIHDYLFSVKTCSCNIWVTGCKCGVFQKEKSDE